MAIFPIFKLLTSVNLWLYNLWARLNLGETYPKAVQHLITPPIMRGVRLGLVVCSTIAAPVSTSLVESITHRGPREGLRHGVSHLVAATATPSTAAAPLHLSVVSAAECSAESGKRHTVSFM